MVALNDEVIGRLTDQAFEGEIVLGVPHDIVYPAIPRVLQRFNAGFPRVKVQLLSSYSRQLKHAYARGECDLILTTEPNAAEGSETIAELPLNWIGAAGGSCWRQRPLRLAFGRHCMFRPEAIDALNRAGIDWDLAVESESDRTIEATVSADLALTAMLDGSEPPHLEQVDHGGALPELPAHKINLYVRDVAANPLVGELAALIRQTINAYAGAPLRKAG